MTRRLMAEIDRLKADLAIATAAMWATLRAIAAKPDLPGRLVYDALHDEYKRIKEPNAETLQALKDCDEGNVTSYADADEFFAGLDEPDSDVDWEDITAMSRSDEIPYERQLFAKAILANKDGVTANRLNLAQVVDDIAANKAEINDLKIEYKGTCASLGLERINRRYETTDLRKRVAELEKRVPTDEQMTTAMLRAAKNKLVEKQRYDEAAKVREVIKMLTGKPTPPEECSKEEHDRLRKQAADVGIAAAKKKPECICKQKASATMPHHVIRDLDPNCPVCNLKPKYPNGDTVETETSRAKYINKEAWDATKPDEPDSAKSVSPTESKCQPGTLVWGRVSEEYDWYVEDWPVGEPECIDRPVRPGETSVGRIAIEALTKISETPDEWTIVNIRGFIRKTFNAIGNTVTVERGGTG